MATDPTRVQSLFAAASEYRDPAARSAFLADACGGDGELKARVEALLRAHDQPDSLLDAPLVDRPNPSNAAACEFAPKAGTAIPPGADETDRTYCELLAYLAPATRPDSLGRLGHYDLLEVLGQGGFGIVFRAFDDVLKRVVAVKVMAPQLAVTSPARKRFLREARGSAAVRHENVVQIYKVAEEPLPYLVMEFIPGETLQQRIDRTGPLGLDEVLRVGVQMAEGLAAAHATDLIHRDIKPANVLIESGKQVKITDFGLARAADDASLTQSGMIAGTPMYMAPEQALGLKLDQRADLFSLGSVLYHMVSGRAPFRAPSTLAVLKRVAEDPPRPIREIIPETPGWLCDIIGKLHTKNPDDRYQTSREVADVLAACEGQLKARGGVSSSFPAPTGKPRRFGRRMWATVAALTLPLIALGITALSGTRPGTTADGQVGPPVPGAAGKDGFPPPQPEESKSPLQATDPDRVAAVYVLSIGGTVKVNGQDEEIRGVAGLPPDSFRLSAVDLGSNKQVSDAGLGVFKDCRNLTHVLLYGTPVGDEGVAHLKGCTGLTQLDLNDTLVGDAGPAAFKDCTSLTHLGLAGTRVGNAGLAHVKNWNNLMFLYLHITQVSDAGLPELHNCRNLTKLSLDRTRVTAEGIGALKKSLPGCTIIWDGGVEPGTNSDPDRRAAMRVLALGGAVQVDDQTGFIEDPAKLPPEPFRLRTVHLLGKPQVADADLATFKDCAALAFVRLNGTPVSDAGLAHIKSCKKLTGLGLESTQVTDAGLAHIKDCKQLHYLGLDGTPVGDDGLAHCRGWTELRFLNLRRTRVTDAGLVNFKDCKHLMSLGLSDTTVGDAGLANFKDFTNLRSIYLHGTRVSDLGVAYFKDCKKLTHFNLSGTGVSDTALAHLKDCPELATLALKGTRVSAAGVAALKKTLPNCVVEWEAAAPGTADEVAARGQQAAWAERLKLPLESEAKIGLKLVLIPPAGGAAPGAYYLGKYETTQAEWVRVMGYNPSLFGGVKPGPAASPAGALPVESVTWYDCVEFCNKLSEREGLSPYYRLAGAKRGGKDDRQIVAADVVVLGGGGYRLPTGEEWEHACRAGAKSQYHCGDRDEELPAYAWFDANSGRRPHPVGQKRPNAFGLHDTHGNVLEWTEEVFATERGPERYARGGDAFNAAGNCATSARLQYVAGGRFENIGLRVARTPPNDR